MPSATESKPETRKVVSIVGPTASGKTGLGIAIAKALEAKGEQAEIVNADAYQMYKGMDIGTAKASPEEQAEVRHHLIDIIEPDDAMSVARFQEIARAKIAELQARGVRPILVGGSGLYARAASTTFPFLALTQRCANASRNVKRSKAPVRCSTSSRQRIPKPRPAWIRTILDAPSARLRSSK